MPAVAMNRGVVRSAVLCASLGLAGGAACGPYEVPAYIKQSANLAISVQLLDAGADSMLRQDGRRTMAPAPGALVIRATLHPGEPPDGKGRRALANDTLRVAGRVLRPVHARGDSVIYYLVEPAAPTDFARELVTIQPPIVLGHTTPTLASPAVAVGKGEGDTLRLAAGAALRVRTRPPAGGITPPPGTHRWALDVRGAAAPFVVGGTGVPPAAIVVPAELLPAAAGGTFIAVVAYEAILSGGVPTGAPVGQGSEPRPTYVLTAAVRTSLRHVVRVGAGP